MANRGRKRMVNEPEHLDDLAKVTTVKEVMNLYDISHPSSVIALIERGDISAMKVCGTWLISLDSVVAWYGKPKHIA